MRWKRLLGGQARGGGLHGEFVTLRAEADDAAHGDVREIRVMAEFLAREGVRQVQFDERQLHAEQRVAQRDAGVGEAAGVEDGEADAIGLGRLNAIDELVLRVALEGDELVAELVGGDLGALFDGGQRVRAVDFGLALPSRFRFGPLSNKSRAIRLSERPSPFVKAANLP